jgi:hypothetical protein
MHVRIENKHTPPTASDGFADRRTIFVESPRYADLIQNACFRVRTSRRSEPRMNCSYWSQQTATNWKAGLHDVTPVGSSRSASIRVWLKHGYLRFRSPQTTTTSTVHQEYLASRSKSSVSCPLPQPPALASPHIQPACRFPRVSARRARINTPVPQVASLLCLHTLPLVMNTDSSVVNWTRPPPGIVAV